MAIKVVRILKDFCDVKAGTFLHLDSSRWLWEANNKLYFDEDYIKSNPEWFQIINDGELTLGELVEGKRYKNLRTGKEDIARRISSPYSGTEPYDLFTLVECRKCDSCLTIGCRKMPSQNGCENYTAVPPTINEPSQDKEERTCQDCDWDKYNSWSCAGCRDCNTNTHSNWKPKEAQVGAELSVWIRQFGEDHPKVNVGSAEYYISLILKHLQEKERERGEK